MESSLIALTLISIILIIIMLSCFICFTRWRRKEEEELMEQVQYSTNQHQAPTGSHHHGRHHLQQQTAGDAVSIRHPSDSSMITGGGPNSSRAIMIKDSGQQRNSREHLMLSTDYHQASHSTNPYISVTASPFSHHTSQTNILGSSETMETKSDITQQINSAIIGSSEAEFQNDFIQVSGLKTLNFHMIYPILINADFHPLRYFQCTK